MPNKQLPLFGVAGVLVGGLIILLSYQGLVENSRLIGYGFWGLLIGGLSLLLWILLLLKSLFN
jgi:hypothetical protein